MKQIVLVGAGKALSRDINLFENNFKKIVIADNSVKKFGSYDVVKTTELDDSSGDIFYITSSKFFKEIFSQLIVQKINKDKIYAPHSFNEIFAKIDKNKFDEDMALYNKLFDPMDSRLSNFKINPDNLWPILNEYRSEAGGVEPTYFYMDVIMANQIIKKQPKKHFDIGSRVDGFISHLISAGIETTLIDVRPLSVNKIPEIPELHFLQSDATSLSNIKNNSINSLSSLHAVEHFGLGRYGDPIDPAGPFKAMSEMERVLAKDGMLYFAVPVGTCERVVFNAHRIFNIQTIVRSFSGLALQKFYLLHNGNATLYTEQDVASEKYLETLGYEGDCGLFIFKK